MNALTDERTLLRTGFINLFKEGFWNVEALESLLAGIITASYKVSYFDSTTLQWGTGWINHPVMFLPAERKLLELRALMDRALDILREIARDISRGYQEYIIWDYNEFKSKLNSVIKSINEFFAEDYKAITGTPLPDNLKLQFVEPYYKRYVEALGIWRKVYTVRRIRYWTQRWLGWVMYRFAYGAVAPEDMDKLLTCVKNYAKLTPDEYNFIKEVMDILYGIVKREYTPTPSQLATLSEYMVIPEGQITSVFEARLIPEEWRKIWRRYIDIRPIADDVKSLLTSYRRALLYVSVPKELTEKVEKYAQLIGFTAREWEVLRLRVQLEELILQSRQYLPTPTMLATLSEYIALPLDLIKQTLEQRGVPEKWMNIWLTYVKTRPIKADAKALLSVYIRALRYDAVTKEEVDKFLAELPTYGFTPKEIEFITKRIELEEAITEIREQRAEYIPTPSMLATLSEYLVISEELIKKVFDARKVPEEWRAIWSQYIDVRPIADDIRGLLTSYRRALLYVTIPPELEEKIKQYANLIGFTKREFDILGLRVQLEELIMQARENRREYIPTPYSLATMAEYIPKVREFFDEVMKARHVPKEWIPIWAEYIDLRPLIDEVKKMVSRVEDLYVYFMITEEDFKKVLDQLKIFGYTPKEIELMLTNARYERHYRAWRELIGDVDHMTMLAEYSPDARTYALGQLYKMIDALPVDEETKAVLKKMWEQYIRLKPIMDEVRRYITELLSDFAEGIITEQEFVNELEALKEWGLDDYEIMFYKAIGGMRRARYLRRSQRTAY